jgi:hypothetical protein
MNRRGLVGGLLVIVCLAILLGVWSQRSQLAGLRAEQRQLLAQMASKADGSASPGAAEAAGAGSETPQPRLVATPELLRLRSEVTRLTERRRELAGVRAENERLRAQLASRGTNGPGGFQLPPGYVRRSEARMVGYSTPDDTLQSLLWAIQNHDLTNVLQAFAPERTENLRAKAGETPESIEEFFSEAAGLVGVRIVNREQDASDGSLTVQVEVVPGEPGPRITFRQINGQWRIAGPF